MSPEDPPKLKERLFQAKNGIILGFVFLLIGVLGFEAGLMYQGLATKESLLIELPTTIPEVKAVIKEEKVIPVPPPAISGPVEATSGSCAFVGSKNSNKYHDPSSRCAKQIKKENIVCFENVERAKARGYVAGCLD